MPKHTKSSKPAVKETRQNTEAVEAVSTLKFSDLALSKEVAQAIQSIGYEIPSPIQAQAIPYLLEGRDILGVAQTGTGKTAAFALPLLSKLDINQKQPQILCLAPTRELAIQVAEAFQTYAQFIKGFKVLPIYGGTDYSGQIRQLSRGVHVVVGTPGRVMDHMRKGTLQLNQINTLVLDEADEMLRMGFIDDVEWILEHIPAEHQNALFSATMPAPIKKLTEKYLKNPAEITIKQKTTTAAGIRQRYVQLKNNEKLDVLTRIMEVEEFDAMLIFVRTKNATLEVADRLQARGFSVSPLNGDIAQNQREKIVNNLKNGKLDVVVATDVAARGLDVERISHVINYDIPYDTESYVHRIGRTGRAGRTGDAILFINGREQRMLQAIERATRKQIDVFKFPSVDILNDRKFEQLFSRIDTELEKDLTEYLSVVKKYIEERSDIDVNRLAAALASIEADSAPFYIKASFTQPSQGRFEPELAQDRGRKGRDDRRDGQRGRDDRPERSGRKERPQLDELYTMKTFRLDVGEAHGAEKRDIVGAIANEAGIESKYMGKIFIHQEHSTIELPEGMPDDLIRDLKKVRIRNQQINLREASLEDMQSDGRSRRQSSEHRGGGHRETGKREDSYRGRDNHGKGNHGKDSRGKDSRGKDSRVAPPRSAENHDSPKARHRKEDGTLSVKSKKRDGELSGVDADNRDRPPLKSKKPKKTTAEKKAKEKGLAKKIRKKKPNSKV